jgi:hypothetical protein
MAIQDFPSVEPGDLITAALMQDVIDSLKDLETRVRNLEASTGASQVTITNVTGVSTPIRLGTRITATGTNFAQPAVLNTVTIDGQPVLNLSTIESSATKLVFDPPNLTDLPEGGRTVTLRVENANGFATFQFTLAPVQQIPAGNVQVLYTTAPVLPIGQNITLGQPYIFTFRVTAFATLATNYRVEASVTGASGWTTEVLQESGDTPGTGIFNIPGVMTGSSKDVRVRVTLASSGGAGTLNINVTTEQTTQVLPGNVAIVITPGQQPPTPETRVRIALSSPVPVGGRVQFTRNTIGSVDIEVSVTEQGIYNVTAAMRNPTGWTSNGLDISSFRVTTNPPAGNPAKQLINAAFTPGATATNTDLVFTVTRATDSINVPYSLPVSVTG